MSKQLFLDGASWDSTRETRVAQQPISASARPTTSYGDSRGSMSTSLRRVLDGQPTLPAELFIEIVEQLTIPQFPSSFCLDKGALKTLASLAVLNETFNEMVTPILYRRIRLATPSAIISLHSTLSYPPRGTYLSSFVRYFLANGSTNEAAPCIPVIIALIKDSVEYVHIDTWPCGSASSELRNSIASVRSLKKLAMLSRGGSASSVPQFNNWSILESVLLDVLNVPGVIKGLLSDISNDVVVRHNLSVYCFASLMSLRMLCGRVRWSLYAMGVPETDRPPFKIIVLFPETSTIPADLWDREQPAPSDCWYCLPVPHRLGNLDSPDFHQWLCTSVENGSFWEIIPIPMDKWVTRVKEKSLPTQDVLDMQMITTGIQTLATQSGVTL